MDVPEIFDRGGVNGDDGVLNDGLGSDQLVIGGVVQDFEDLALSANLLGDPGKVTFVQSKASSLAVSTSASDGDYLSLAQLGARRLSAHLELPLLSVDRHSASRQSSLVF